MPGLKTTRKYGGGDQRWAVNTHAFRDALSGHLSLSSFTRADHYPDGFFPSGTPVNTADESDLKPWTGASGEKLGFILTDQPVPVGDDEIHNVAYLWHGPINARLVPGEFIAPTDGAHNFNFVGVDPSDEDEDDDEGGEG